LAIYDFAKGAVVNVSSNRFREIVIDASPRHTNFFTLTRLDAPKLIIRERGEKGAILSVMELPFFVSGFASHNWIKMSPDRTRLVFHNPATRGLSLLSLQNQEQRDVLRDSVPSEQNIVLMKWLSGDTVLLLRRGVGDAAAAPGQILKINVDSGATQAWPRSFEIGTTAHALSQSGAFLATVGYARGSKVAVLDVATMGVVRELPCVRPDQTIGDVCWLADDQRLAFWSVGDGVYSYTLGTGETTRFPLKGKDRYALKGAAGRCLVLSKQSIWGPGHERTYELYDVESGRRTRLDANISGFVYGIADNTKLVMEVGY